MRDLPLESTASDAPNTSSGAAAVSEPDRSLARLPGVLAHLAESDDAAANLLELLRTASRHLRKLMECERARIWLARRGGTRLVARDFPDTGDGPAIVHRLTRDEGRVG